MHSEPALSNGCTEIRFSRRQRQILQGLLDGLTNGEIAQRAYISEGTVKVYLCHVGRKIGPKYTNRLAMAMWILPRQHLLREWHIQDSAPEGAD